MSHARFAHNCAWATWAYVLETVCGPERRLVNSRIAPLNAIIIIIFRKRMVLHRSPAIPHSLVVVVSPCSHGWCLCCHQRKQSWSIVVDCLFCFFAIAECRVHDASWLQVCLQAAVAGSQLEDTGLHNKRVPGQNGVSLLYIMLEIHHSGREPSSHVPPDSWLALWSSCSLQGFISTGRFDCCGAFQLFGKWGGHRLRSFTPRLDQAICS